MRLALKWVLVLAAASAVVVGARAGMAGAGTPSQVSVPFPGSSTATSTTTLPGEEEVPGAGAVQNLTYPTTDNPAVGAGGSALREPGPSTHDVVPLGMVAAALLLVALAAHLLYVRGLADAKRLRDGKVG